MPDKRIWDSIASYCSHTYESFVNWDEGFFYCPHCGEKIHEADWFEDDYLDLAEKSSYKECHCPICGFVFNPEN